MNISNNPFSKDFPNKSSNTFSQEITASSNSFARVTKNLALQPWEGDNLNSTPYGFDGDFFGDAYGSVEYGGIDHFKARTGYTPNHS